MITSLYRKLFPLSVRTAIYDLFLGRIIFTLRNSKVITKSKFIYAFNSFLPKTEENSAYTFIGRHGITSYPHAYSLSYRNLEVAVIKDQEKNLHYVSHHGRRLYFPEKFSVEKIQRDYRALLIEQDERSAHRYVRSYDELRGRVLLDVGAAEGIFSLDTIELTSHVYLFECMEYWQKPLQATFSAWPDKVTIVKKYVGDKATGEYVTLDDFFATKDKSKLFIKMDIEGAERLALQGAKGILKSSRDIQLSVCTYHRPGDPEYFKALFEQDGFETEFSEGMMYWNKRVSKGLIRAKKA